MGNPHRTGRQEAVESRPQVKELAEEFQSRGLATKIVIYGHNWDNLQYARDILNNAEVRPLVEAVAFHCYGGDYKAPQQLNEEFDIDTYFTECSPHQGGRCSTCACSA